MRVAVVTPRFREPIKQLEQCIESVRAQSVPCTHILVNDGGDRAVPFGDLQVIDLPKAHGDFGDTPRAIGSVSAISQGFDALLWLDADNWFLPDHVESMLEKHKATSAPIVTSRRILHSFVDDSVLGICDEVDGDIFVDTNCFFLTKPVFKLVQIWFLMPRELHESGDRVFWGNIRGRYQHAHTGRATVAYRTKYKRHFIHFGRPIPEGAKESVGSVVQAS